jgi:hypothetical protein
MGLLHAAYGESLNFFLTSSDLGKIGAGAFIVPLIATQFAEIPRWSFHYLTSLGVALANAVVLLLVFKLRSQDGKILVP